MVEVGVFIVHCKPYTGLSMWEDIFSRHLIQPTISETEHNKLHFIEVDIKNLGRLWLAYTELQGDFYMLQLMTDDTHTSIM